MCNKSGCYTKLSLSLGPAKKYTLKEYDTNQKWQPGYERAHALVAEVAGLIEYFIIKFQLK
jgi:hypothetical protein